MTPATMLAVVCRFWAEYRNLPLEYVPRPPMRPHGVRIATHAAGVSFATTLIAGGQHQTKPPFPFSPGTEVAGTVIECAPEVTRFKLGDRVCAAPEWGGHAEEVVALEHDVFAIPPTLPFSLAVAFPLSYGTAYAALIWRARIQPGETLLIFGATGAVGLAAVEIGKVLGAKVIACVGTTEKAAVAKAHGANEVIDYRTEDVLAEVRRLTDGRGVDVVFDPVGGALFETALRVAAPLARLICIGFASGNRQSIPANILLVKNVDVIGFYFGRYIWGPSGVRLPCDDAVAAAFTKMFEWYADGMLRPCASHIFSLAQYREAMQSVIDRQGIGKVVLTMPIATNEELG